MIGRHFFEQRHTGSRTAARAIISGLAASLFGAVAGFAAQTALDNIRLSNDIAPAPFGYEPLTTKYVVAEPTPIYISPYIYPGTVNNDKLKVGQAVEALAKVKDYDWILVGKDGIGIGYIPIARLAPARR